MKSRSSMVLRAVSVAVILACCGKNASLAQPTGSIPITISSTVPNTVPNELNPSGGGAPMATMQQAAAFAWQEFIALNWPAVNQTGGPNQRDTPDNNCRFGDPKCNGPLVWETFRSKVEIFPGQGNPPGYPGVVPNDPSFGYDALPSYVYGPATPGNACDTPPPTGTVWINLDETDQITLASMFAGVAPTQAAGNSLPQLVRFLAKANRTEYVYVAQNKCFGGVTSEVKTAGRVPPACG
jgi:hypothetical protein